MSLVCAISGVVPEDPVFSPGGVLYERRIIEAALKQDKHCPVTGVHLTAEQLISVKSSKIVKPTPPELIDLTGSLKNVQTGVDSLVVHLYETKKERDEARTQLSASVYEHDASCRTIAALLKEVDDLKKRIHQLEAADATPIRKRRREEHPTYDFVNLPLAPSEEISSGLFNLASTLRDGRKQRNVQSRKIESLTCAKLDFDEKTAARFTAVSVLFSCLDEEKERRPRIVATGSDTGIHVFDLVKGRKLNSMSEQVDVTAVVSLVHPSVTHLAPGSLAALGSASNSCSPFSSPIQLLSSSKNGTLYQWTCPGYGCLDDIPFISSTDVRGPTVGFDSDLPDPFNFTTAATFNAQMGCIPDVTLHPSGKYFGCCFESKEIWSFCDYLRMQPICCPKLRAASTKLRFHPDGILTASALVDNGIAISDCRDGAVRLELESVDVTSRATSFSFSENGFFFVSGHEKGEFALWDLRKGHSPVQTGKFAARINSCDFSFSGQNIVFGTDESLVVYHMATKNSISESWRSPGGFSSVAFDRVSDEYVVGISTDGIIRTLHS